MEESYLPSSLPRRTFQGLTGEALPFCPLEAAHRDGLQELHAPSGSHGPLSLHMAAREGRSLVWIQDALSELDFGAISARGLAAWGLDPAQLIRVRAKRAVDVLWAMEEVVSAGLNVIGEIEGAPRALDFTATRRLAMRARAAQTACVLVRLGARASLERSSGARWRWSVMPSRSSPDPCDARAPGRSRWSLQMRRAPSRPPGKWILEATADDDRSSDRAAYRLRVVSVLADRKLAPSASSAQAGTATVALPTVRRIRG